MSQQTMYQESGTRHLALADTLIRLTIKTGGRVPSETLRESVYYCTCLKVETRIQPPGFVSV